MSLTLPPFRGLCRGHSTLKIFSSRHPLLFFMPLERVSQSSLEDSISELLEGTVCMYTLYRCLLDFLFQTWVM